MLASRRVKVKTEKALYAANASAGSSIQYVSCFWVAAFSLFIYGFRVGQALS